MNIEDTEKTRKQNLKGSDTRDAFKHWHKTLDKSFYSCDIDFVFVVKKPHAHIVAVIDFKTGIDSITFTEVIVYNEIKEMGIPIYIVSANPSLPPYVCMTIKQYMDGDWRPNPPHVNLKIILENITVEKYAIWEKDLRNKSMEVSSVR